MMKLSWFKKRRIVNICVAKQNFNPLCQVPGKDITELEIVTYLAEKSFKPKALLEQFELLIELNLDENSGSDEYIIAQNFITGKILKSMPAYISVSYSKD